MNPSPGPSLRGRGKSKATGGDCLGKSATFRGTLIRPSATFSRQDGRRSESQWAVGSNCGEQPAVCSLPAAYCSWHWGCAMNDRLLKSDAEGLTIPAPLSLQHILTPYPLANSDDVADACASGTAWPLHAHRQCACDDAMARVS